MTARRVAALVAVVLASTSPLQARSPVSIPEAIPDWAAPPYWMPQKPSDKVAVSNEELRREPQAVEGVPTPALAFTGIAPCRIVDTRGNGFTGAYGPPALIAGVGRSFTLPGQCGISGASQAVSLNITVTNPQGPGHIVIYPQGGAQPTVSTLNYVAGQTIANAAVVPLGVGGGITIVAGVSGTDLLIDTNGHYAPQTVVNTVNGVSGALSLAEGSNITITPSGQTLTIAATTGLPSPPAWSLTGNAGTSPASNYLGTTDSQALELRVNGQPAFRLEPGTSPNVIGGGGGNAVTPGVRGATIGGGGGAFPNAVTDDFGTVGGGAQNMAGDGAGTLSDREVATVCGGIANKARGNRSFVGGGANNDANGPLTTIGGGAANVASGFYSTIPAGYNNTTIGQYSFAAGRQAKAAQDGAFVWGDNTAAEIASTAANQFLVRANGGAVFIRATASVPTVAAAFSSQNGGVGEAAWLYTSSPSDPWPVVKLLKNSSSTNNYLECESVGVGLKCHITSAGTFVAGSDFAEALPAKGGKAGFEPGDVLVMSGDAAGSVERSSQRYDTRVIGVYSTRPAVLGAEKNGETRVDPDDVPVAITGIVPTRVTSENGTIRPGDLLTTSSTPGYAMKATTHPPGTIVGKALETLDGGKGTIRVLVLMR
jgi:hypothetical protein